MLTPRRLRAMAHSYGADLLRWPDEARAEAQALLEVSPEARPYWLGHGRWMTRSRQQVRATMPCSGGLASRMPRWPKCGRV